MDNQIKALQLLSKKKSTSHVLHLILSIVTVGFWVPVWFIVAPPTEAAKVHGLTHQAVYYSLSRSRDVQALARELAGAVDI